FADDDYSGTNWERPAWKELMSEIESGNVSVIIVKDMSRVGRDYLRVGLFMEMLRENGIRLIAVNDSVDTLKGDDDFTPFRNIISEWYARDTSKKIKSVLHAKGNSGKHMTNAAIYGYVKDPADKNHWLIDPEAAAVVRRIFNMTIEGKGAYQIARILTDEKVTRPQVYIAIRDGGNYVPKSADEPYTWGGRSVQNILDKLEYAGHTVNFKTEKSSYKSRKMSYRPQDEWVVFENTQEPIIDTETWHTAQKCRTVRRRGINKDPNPLTGLLYCGDCGSRLYNHRGTLAGVYDSQDSYACNQYSKYPPKCTRHYIRTSTAQNLILGAIKSVSDYVRNNQAEFIKIVRDENELRHEQDTKTRRKQLVKNQKRYAELDTIIKRLFEEKISGAITDKRFEILSGDYEREQSELETQIAELQAGLEQYQADGEKAEQFIKVVKKYTDFTELTPSMLNEYIEKVIIYEPEKVNGRVKKQKVEIFLNFIGKFDLPIDGEDEPEEAEEIDLEEIKKAKWRENYYKNREQILAKKAAERTAVKERKLTEQPLKSPEEIAAEQQARRERKREYQREYQRKWREQNPERWEETLKRHQAKKKKKTA
ncbi:MAG: DUF4368 domain-containing protein, partial [Oscillospiraceae bacterium]|nr:DUF4368 domain-containing protein [Oscillospiraceae bacterium]